MLLLYVTHPSKEAATQLCEELMQKRLIACYNLLPIESAYWWHGKIEQADEVVSLLKTRPELASEVEVAVMQLHSYHVPCILHWEVAANADYEQWIQQETRISI